MMANGARSEVINSAVTFPVSRSKLLCTRKTKSSWVACAHQLVGLGQKTTLDLERRML